MTVSLLIMTLNEIDGMKKLMPKINPDWVDEIILVDGGSTDGTIQEAEKYGLKILHQQKKGHGAGILEGIESTSSDFIVIWAPDGNHEPEEIPLLIEKSKEGFDQVIISRFGNGSINEDANLLENFGNRMFAFLANAFFGGNYTDSLNESRINDLRKSIAAIANYKNPVGRVLEKWKRPNKLSIKKLAEVAFSSQIEQKILNGLMWPEIFVLIENQIKEYESKGNKLFVLDAAMIFEGNFEHMLDATLLISSRKTIRIKRALKRKNLHLEQIQNRMSLQMTEKDKKKRASYIIQNDGTLDNFHSALQEYYQSLSI